MPELREEDDDRESVDKPEHDGVGTRRMNRPHLNAPMSA